MKKIVKAKTIYKDKLLVYADDLIGKNIIEKGIYDKRQIEAIRIILSHMKSPVFLDIGANIGNHTVAFAPFCSKVYAFEPQEKTGSILQKNIHENKLLNVTVLPYGLSDTTDQLELHINMTGNNGMSSFCNGHNGNVCEKQTAKVNIGDNIIRELGIQSVDFIKIDVEGFEAKVLNGLQNTIKKHQPFICLEWNRGCIGDEDKSKVDYICNNLLLDYTVYKIADISGKKYWAEKKFGNIKRILHRLTRNNLYLIPVTMNHTLQNIILIPREKASIIQKTSLITLY